MSKKAKAHEWQARDISDWNATTYRAYLSERHEELYGIPYVTRNYAMEGRMLKTLYETHGKEATTAFIDACLAEYKPSKQYPGINFAFMYSYMRRLLPQVLADNKAEIKKIERRKAVDYEKIAELL